MSIQKVAVRKGTDYSEEMINDQWSIVICHRWWRFAHLFLKDGAPKARPKMTNDN
jgi:hypothetical protein